MGVSAKDLYVSMLLSITFFCVCCDNKYLFYFTFLHSYTLELENSTNLPIIGTLWVLDGVLAEVGDIVVSLKGR